MAPLGSFPYFIKNINWKAQWKDDDVAIPSSAPTGSCPGMTQNVIPPNLSHEPMQSCPRKSTSCCNKFNPNPIRHYRRSYGNPKGKIPVGTFDVPGGTIFSHSKEQKCNNEESSCGLNVVGSYLTKRNINTNCSNNTGTCGTPGNALARVRNGTTKGTKYCNQGRNSIENQSIKTKQGEVQKPNLYYGDSRSYLRAKNKTFQQKLSKPRAVDQNQEDVSDDIKRGLPVEFRTGFTVEQVPQPNQPKACCSTTIYRTNNPKFKTTGAVSSSTRLLDLQKTTIDKAASSLSEKFGQAAAAASQYSSNKTAPYTNKSNYSKPQKKIHSVNGVQKLCCENQ